MKVSIWFIGVFVVMWLLGSASQVLQLVAPQAHKKLGMMEAAAYEPRFRWFALVERGTAYADLTHFSAGIAFVILALGSYRVALIFGLYTCAAYVFVMTQYLVQLMLLNKEGLHPVSGGQLVFYRIYGIVFIAFGLFGLFYLWGLT